VRNATGAVLAFTDSDCVPAEDWLERGYARVMALTQPAFVAGRIDVFAREPTDPTAAERYEQLHAFPQRRFAEQLHFAATANLFVHRDVFARVGEFSDELISSGDREWGQRAAARGVAAVYADDAPVRHPARRSLAELARKARRVQAGRAQLRRVRGESLGPAAALRPLFRPPLRTIAHNLERLRPAGLRVKASYAGLALLVFYLGALEQARAAYRERAATRA
jgi:GT2 family glycosyltransferase